MTRSQLVQLIHIAKTQLALDDETYRAKLKAVTGKTSCAKLSYGELHMVYEAFKKSGFKHRPKVVQTHFKNGTPKPKVNNVVAKIFAVWTTMYHHGFIQNNSETSLNTFVKYMTVKRNKGLGIENVRWLKPNQLQWVIECMKAWHRRQMLDELIKQEITTEDDGLSYAKVLELYELNRR